MTGPRKLTRADLEAAKAYADRNPTDPFAYARALSRISNGILNRDDLAGGASI